MKKLHHWVTHGARCGNAKPAEYEIWKGMQSRCNRPTNRVFPHYGGRGIKVCDRWSSYANFLEDMGPRPSPNHSIERKDNDGPYSPENCVWATQKDQMRNTRVNRWVETPAGPMILADAAKTYGIHPVTLAQRARKGWSGDRLVAAPSHSIRTTNRFVATPDGEQMTVAEAARRFGLLEETLRYRLNRGKSGHELFAKP